MSARGVALGPALTRWWLDRRVVESVEEERSRHLSSGIQAMPLLVMRSRARAAGETIGRSRSIVQS